MGKNEGRIGKKRMGARYVLCGMGKEGMTVKLGIVREEKKERGEKVWGDGEVEGQVEEG